MGDTFSVAGGAVGVISLGLTVCQGLLAYYGPFKAVDEQIHEIGDNNQTCLTKAWKETPLCDLEVFLQKTHWLISKGADVYHQASSGSALPHIGKSVGSILYWMKEEGNSSLKIHLLSEPSRALLRTVFPTILEMIVNVPVL